MHTEEESLVSEDGWMVSSWFGWFRSGLMLASSVILLILGTVILLPKPPPASIQIGYDAEGVMYGGLGVERGVKASDCCLVPFRSGREFSAWAKQPLAKGQKARIWIDPEKNVIFILQRDALGKVQEFQVPLADTLAGRKKQIESLVCELK